MRARGRQKGVALITVLLVFALAAIIASDVASRNFRDIRKTSNFINSKQAYHFALAGEQFARQILYRDFVAEKDLRVDTLRDSWADIAETFDIEEGVMTIEITDAQSKFNLNNLIDEAGQVRSSSLNTLRQLLSLLRVDESVAMRLVDWQDRNQIALKGGAEDEIYQQLGYLTANQPIVDRTELRLLHELSVSDYNTLKDHVVALPLSVGDKKTSQTKYNLNTLDAKIIESILTSANGGSASSTSASSGDISRIIARQKAGGYDSLPKWSANGYIDSSSITGSRFSVSSEFFEILVKVKYDQRISVIRTQVYRDSSDGKITLLKRQQGIE